MSRHGSGSRLKAEELAEKRLTRARRIKEVSVSLLGARKRKDSRDKTFLCNSDICKIWSNDLLLEDFFFDSKLTGKHFEVIRGNLLPFLSFLVWIDVPEDWYADFQTQVFNNSSSTFDLPKPHDQLIRLLVSLGIAAEKAEKSWEDQYLFAPVTINFAPQTKPQKITDTARRLPFEQCADPALTQKGGFGDVEFYRISPEYVQDQPYNKTRWKPDEPYAVAVKSIRPKEGSTRVQENEIETLYLLKNMLTIHNNRISIHHAIIEHGTKFLIIFPLADLGDLDQFLRCEKAVGDDGHLFNWYTFKERFPTAAKPDVELAPALLKQCVGVAEALRFLHGGFNINEKEVRYELAHMDLKPNNIIISSSTSPADIVGIWKLADFGISVLKEVTSIRGRDVDQRTMNTTAKRPPSTYQAPEIEQGYEGPDIIKVGRKSDIWSFGAIFSEVLTFALKRSAGVEEFGQRRYKKASNGTWGDKFYSLKGGQLAVPAGLGVTQEFNISPEVSIWLQGLCEGSSTPQSYVDCWTKCIRRLLIADPQKRTDATHLLGYVQHVLEHTRGSRQSREIVCIFDEAHPTTSDEIIHHSPARSSHQSSAWSSPLGNRGSLPPPMQLLLTAPTFPLAGDGDRGDAILRSAVPHDDDFTGQSTGARAGIFDEPDALESENSMGISTRTSISSTRFRQESVASRRTGSVDFGRPKDAHGILCSPDIPRRKTVHEKWKVNMRVSGATAISLDLDRLAFLVKSKILLFKINSTARGEAIAGYDLTLDLGDSTTSEWTGVCIAGSVVVGWGYSKESHKSLLQIFTLRNDFGRTSHQRLPIHVDPKYYPDLDKFDYRKRVTASSKGFVAMINGNRICIVKVQEPAKVFIRKAPTTDGPDFEFTDVSFNESGAILFGWAVRLKGVLLAYGMSDLTNDRPDSTGYYSCDTSEDEDCTKVIPYNSYHGCIVAASSNHLFFPAVIKGSSIDETRPLPRRTSDQFSKFTSRSAAMYQNHSLIIAQKVQLGSVPHQLHYRLKEYPLTFHDGHHAWGNPEELCKLDVDTKSSSQIKAFRSGNSILILVCHLSGEVESIKFEPQ